MQNSPRKRNRRHPRSCRPPERTDGVTTRAVDANKELRSLLSHPPDRATQMFNRLVTLTSQAPPNFAF